MSVNKNNFDNIHGVKFSPLRVIPDERGAIFHGGKQSEFEIPFKEVYFKKLFSGVINGWHLHETMTLNYVCIFGHLKLVLFDMRQDSTTFQNIKEFYLGEHNHGRVTIPPGVANAAQCINGNFSLFANFASMEHDPSLRYKRIDPLSKEIPYEWNNKNY